MAITMYDLAGVEADRRFSPFCWRAKMALAHKGLAVETVPWRFTEKDKLPQPNAGRVPVIRDGDRVVHDSTAIADYLEERYPDRPSLFGARTAFIVGLTSALVGGLSGLVIGVASAYFGGQLDLWLQRLLDIVMAFPLIIMALAVVSIFGTGIQNVIVAITIPLIPRCARVVRSSALAIREVPYVDAARALGFGHTRIILAHMVPNVMGPFLVIITAFVGQAILAEAALSYLGLGVQEPVPAWGLMLQGGAEEYATTAPWIAVFPGLAIMLTVFGINLFGDSLRDVLDPKMRDR